MNILESIKQDRVLSLNHWRYRILHWTFNVGDIKKPDESNLPRFLYTHYCPLFHLTNLLTILSPFIFMAKLAYVIANPLVKLVAISLAAIADNLIPYIVSQATPEEVETQGKEREIKYFKKKIIEYTSDGYVRDTLEKRLNSFESYWKGYSYCYSYLTKEEAQEIFLEFIERLEAARAKQRLLKERRDAKFVFWINLSRTFCKLAMNIIYFALLISVAAVSVYCIPLVFKFMYHSWFWIMNNFVFIFQFSLGVFVCIALAVGFVALYMSVMTRPETNDFLGKTSKAVVFPFAIILDAMKSLLVYAVGLLKGMKNFMATFYEESCPQIKIVSDEEAELEAEIQGE